MAKYQRKSKGKAINPTFFVFCEGESEDAYISFLRRRLRVPIEIISKIAGYRITWNYINNTLRHRPGHPKDKLFLLYDLDAPGLMEKLGSIKGAGLLLSNPCFELWYILLTVEEELKIIQKLVKQRRESAVIYKEQNRLDLYENETAEANVLEKYLPGKISDEELSNIIKAIIGCMGANSAAFRTYLKIPSPHLF